MLALGVYPAVTLATARQRRDEIREKLAEGIDPGEAKKRVKLAARIAQANRFEVIAREWHERQKAGLNEAYAAKVLRSLENDVFPAIGDRPVTQVEASQIRAILHRIEARGVYDSTRRILQRISAVLQYAVDTERCTRNVARDINPKTSLKKAPPVRHMPHVETGDIPELMRDIENYGGDMVTRLAMQFMMLNFIRTRELIQTPWTEFDDARAEWRIPGQRMKMKDPHIVPLSRQSLDILAQLRAINGDRSFVFCGAGKDRPVSSNTILYALYAMGWKGKMTGHGFRGMAATELTRLGFPEKMIDLQLSHMERNKVKAAYFHADLLPERRAMMQRWADYLDQLKTGVQTVPATAPGGA